jgi:hypothetical protein
MSFAAGLLDGVASGMTRKAEKAERARELSVLEAMAARPAPSMDMGSSFNRAEVRPPRRGEADPYPQGEVDGWDASGVDPSVTSGILETAQSLGMDPEVLATMISYETAGTFAPDKKGPTTQWGQHRGLIQFGEPQAKKYGVDWNDPVGSQLGRDGAVVRYFRDNGWKEGMGMLDAYSIINAGAPGRYNASDANNGGAPGTVRDKVERQMGAHRAKARALLAGNRQPAEPTAPLTPAAPPAPPPAPALTPKGGEWFASFFEKGQ